MFTVWSPNTVFRVKMSQKKYWPVVRLSRPYSNYSSSTKIEKQVGYEILLNV